MNKESSLFIHANVKPKFAQMKRLCISAFTLSSLYYLPVSADTVILSNGDQLTVTIESIESNSVHMVSTILGKLAIPLSGIHSIQFQGSYWIKLKGQTDFQFVAFDEKVPAFYKIDSSREKNLSAIAELRTSKPTEHTKNPLPKIITSPSIEGSVKKTVITADDLATVPENTWLFSNQLSGYIDLKNIGKKDSKELTASASGEHQIRSTSHRNIIQWEIKNAKKEKDTEEKYVLDYSYNYFYTEKAFLTANTTLSHDDDSTPYKLTTTGLGLGYQLYDIDELSLSVEAGAGYSVANYRSKSHVSTPSFYGKVSYNQKITDTIVIFDDTQLNGLIEDSFINIDGKAGLKFMIRENLWLELAHSYSWTNRPDKGYEQYNGNMKAGVGVNW